MIMSELRKRGSAQPIEPTVACPQAEEIASVRTENCYGCAHGSLGRGTGTPKQLGVNARQGLANDRRGRMRGSKFADCADDERARNVPRRVAAHAVGNGPYP